jgi:WD40 repeat protein
MKADPAKTHVAQQWKHGRPLISCRFDPTGKYVFAGAQDFGVHRFEAATGKLTSFVDGHDSWVRGFAFSPDGATVYSGGYDGRLCFWPAAEDTPQPARRIDAHQGWIKALATSRDGSLVASCGNDRLIKLWSAADGTLVRELAGHESHVYNVAFHPDGQHLASIDLKGKIKHWSLADGKLVRDMSAADLHKYDGTFHADIGGARGMEFTPDGKHLACCGITEVSNAFAGIGNPAVVLLDWEKGEKKLLLVSKGKLRGSGWGLSFHPDGYLITAVGGGGGGFLLFHKIDQAAEFFQFKLPNTAHDMHVSPDGLQVAVAHDDRQLRLYALHAKAA